MFLCINLYYNYMIKFINKEKKIQNNKIEKKRIVHKTSQTLLGTYWDI